MTELKRFYEIYIRSDARKIWDALTQAEFTSQYFHATLVESDWQVGSKVVYRMADDSLAVDGEVLEVDPPKRLVITWRALYAEEFSSEGFSKVTFEIAEVDASVCKLSVLHNQFPQASKLYEHVQGWVAIISSLKSLLETGEAMPMPQNESEMPT
jgi:uncharacterized protein YndB with AHSA1/START domain|tara:strand:- start:3369 stop:3833 length:465 start_codon:yes stop_codon:yes gene_type:complete